ncbi:hypothetical protein EV174_002077 [Coemansia sp. RSA 2320]|nr:hypothetical protein EV174_002077 [Coemansia sp. RSA 2320]
MIRHMADSKQEIAAMDDAGGAPTFFREQEAFLTTLDKVTASAGDVETWSQASAPAEEARMIREMRATLELYQEQPTCLDPYLERIVSQLMAAIEGYVHAYHESAAVAADGSSSGTTGSQGSVVSISRLNGVFDLVYTLCKVRGYKTVLRFFPHGVADVEPVLSSLWRYTASLTISSWTARYVMLIWLSLLSKIPFDLDSIDSGAANLPTLNFSDAADVSADAARSHVVLVDRWVELGKFYLRRPGCEMEGAAVMLSRLLTRQDTSASLQPAFIAWATLEIRDAAGVNHTDGSASKKGLDIASVLRINGALRVLCHLLRAMDSATPLQGYIAPLLDVFESDVVEQHSVTRKLIVKAAQRLTLLALPPLSAARRASARPSARTNLGAGTNAGISTICDFNHGADNEVVGDSPVLDFEIPEQAEALVGVLLQRLHDKDTIVRWSAAKGIGRITERLPPALALEIVSAVAGILKEETLVNDSGLIDVSMTSEYSWHGALLSLAELSRRGQLVLSVLRETIPWILRGLTYEIQRGDYSVGSNVRDAACYVMWSFARISNLSTKQLFGELSATLATALISVAVFDRESSNSFPHGIAVLQLADFFSVGIMRNAFVVASRRISEFAEYREPLLRHLCTVTIYHWDLKTRELAFDALRELASLAPDFVISDLLPSMTVLSIGESISTRYIEDFGAALTLTAVVKYIGCLSRARWDIDGDQALNKYFDYFERALTMCPNPQEVVQEFTAFADAYGITLDQHARIVHHTQAEKSGTLREGFVLALGALRTQEDFKLLCKLITEGATVEIRQNAASALGQFCMREAVTERHDFNGDGRVADENVLAAVSALLGGLLDRTVDNRGDVGSWVRRQCLCSLQGLFSANRLAWLRVGGDRDLALRLLGRVLHAATEKIDRLRQAAGMLLEQLLYGQHDPALAASVDVLHADVSRCIGQLRLYVPSGRQGPNRAAGDAGGCSISWADSEAVYAQLVHALLVSENELRAPLFEGFVSAGAAEPQGKFAVNAVAAFAGALPATTATAAAAASAEQRGPGWSIDGLVAELTRLLLTDRQTSKLINPALIVTDRLIEQGALQAASPDM